MSNEEKRRDRINRIFNTIVNCYKKGLACKKEKLIAEVQFELGLSRRIILEYLNVLIGAEKIYEKDENLELTSEVKSQIKTADEEAEEMLHEIVS